MTVKFYVKKYDTKCKGLFNLPKGSVIAIDEQGNGCGINGRTAHFNLHVHFKAKRYQELTVREVKILLTKAQRMYFKAMVYLLFKEII